jgi:hypothetical protein
MSAVGILFDGYRRVLPVTIAVALLSACGASAQVPPPSTPRAATLTLIAAGQSNMVGTEPFLAMAFTGHHVEVTVIPCGVGGTSITRWVPSGDLFQRCLAMAPTHVDGILFYQGEADAWSMTAAQAWASGFAAFVAAMRQHFGLVPLVYAQLGRPLDVTHGPEPGWSLIKAEQAAYTAPMCSMIRVDDLEQLPGDVHFTPTSYRIIAQRFADAILSLISG